MTIRPLRSSDRDELFHLAAGFEEVQRSICFRRSLDAVSP
jgi:hypothetical protein